MSFLVGILGFGTSSIAFLSFFFGGTEAAFYFFFCPPPLLLLAFSASSIAYSTFF